METYHMQYLEQFTSKEGFTTSALVQIGPVFAILRPHPVFDDHIDYYDEEKARAEWAKIVEIHEERKSLDEAERRARAEWDKVVKQRLSKS